MAIKRTLVLVWTLSSAIAFADPLEDGKALLKQRRYKDAIVKLDEASKSDTTGEALYSLAIGYDLSGETAKAIDAYRKVVDGKGKRAQDAERSMKKLEAIVADAAVLEKARVEVDHASVENSERIKQAKARVEAVNTKLAEHQLDIVKKQRARDAAVAEETEAQRKKEGADRVLADWKAVAVASPAGHGRAIRVIGALISAAGGAALGAAAWSVREGLQATDAINNNSDPTWTRELDHYVKYGEIANTRLAWTLPLGGVLTLAGFITLGVGESASSDSESASETTLRVEGHP